MFFGSTTPRLRRKLVDYCPEQGDYKQQKHRNKVDRNAPITSKHVFSKRSAKTSAKRAARYKEFGYNDNELTHAKTSGTVTRDREKNIDQ